MSSARILGLCGKVHTADFLETYAFTPAASSVKAVKNNWELRQLDVKQAFIKADLDFNVFMKLSDGCVDNQISQCMAWSKPAAAGQCTSVM